MSDIKRSCLKSISYLISRFPCVAILGARQAGKTTLLKQVAPAASFFDLEREKDFDLIHRDPEFFLSQFTSLIVLDEAQMCPKLFPALRVAIDRQRGKNGQYLISGSSSPELIKNVTESLAGRVAIFELHPFDLAEAWGHRSLFYDMLDQGKFENLLELTPTCTSEELFQLCFYGGFPDAFLGRQDSKFFDLWMQNYFATYIERDIRRLFPQLNIQAYKKFIKMLGYSSGEIINVANFSRSLDVSQPTVKSYFEIAEATYFWRNISSFQSTMKKRVVKMPRGAIRDTGIINYILNIPTIDAFKTHPKSGLIWEIFITEQLIRALTNRLVSFHYYFYRTHNQAEIDLILEGSWGLIPIEIKLGMTTERKQLLSLSQFIEQCKAPYGILINNAERPIRLTPKIYQVPANCL